MPSAWLQESGGAWAREFFGQWQDALGICLASLPDLAISPPRHTPGKDPPFWCLDGVVTAPSTCL